ncbi:hypothetical protein [Paenibacillus sp. URB8-2]|uniref:hypothetical protein n=1 Tax=Paenibacillus sp. URB8-2 TaxID=2741301 RepID=UPI0015BBE4AF|nr:hypothetical protein [Paenibacillus sp. URB8-2]BCG58859.1 hypothetical protein PUR_22840 [Paenibacillus sp. URB8-2]
MIRRFRTVQRGPTIPRSHAGKTVDLRWHNEQSRPYKDGAFFADKKFAGKISKGGDGLGWRLVAMAKVDNIQKKENEK